MPPTTLTDEQRAICEDALRLRAASIQLGLLEKMQADMAATALPVAPTQVEPIAAAAGVVTMQIGSPRPQALWADSEPTPYTVDEM